MTRRQRDLSERDLRSILPVAYLLRGSKDKRPWPGEPGTRRSRKLTLQPSCIVALIAGLLITIIVVVGFYALGNTSERFRPRAMTLLSGTVAAPEAQGVILSDSTSILFFASELPEPASGFRYVLWRVSQGNVELLGQLWSSSPGSAHLRAEQGPSGSSFHVTLEDSGTNEKPTGPVVLRSRDP